jgi:hypothetical protein
VTGGSAWKHGEVERSHRRIEGGDSGDVLAAKQYQGDGCIGVDRYRESETLRSAPVLAGSIIPNAFLTTQTVAGGVTQINIMIGTLIASLQPGAVSQLYYADRLYELPLALVGIAITARVLSDMRDAVLGASADAPFSESVLAQFQSIAESTRPPDLRVALEGERCVVARVNGFAQ